MKGKQGYQKAILSLFALVLVLPIALQLLPWHPFINPLAGTDSPETEWSDYLDGSMQQGVNEYMKDQMPVFTQMIWLKTKLDLLTGKQESNGVYITDSMLIDKPVLPDSKACSAAAASINEFQKKTGKPCFSLILPTSAQINSAKLPPYAPRTDETGLISSVNNLLTGQTTALDAVTPLSSLKDGMFYYATDPRLTSFGAFAIYNFNIKSMGANPAAMKDFNIEYGTRDFNGSLYERTYYDGVPPDRVDLYHYNQRSMSVQVTSYLEDSTIFRSALYDTTQLSSNDCVNALFGESAPVRVAHTDSGTGKNLILFGDDNADPFIQFFALHYDTVTVVDLSKLTPSLADRIDFKDADQVLFVYGIESLAGKPLDKLKVLSESSDGSVR